MGIYNKIIKLFIENNKNLNINADLLKKAVPYTIREDNYVTSNKKLKQDPTYVLKQILNKEILE